MQTSNQPQNLRSLTVSSIVFGLLGGAFFWFAPLGIVLSMTGMLLGIADSTIARKHSVDLRLSIAGILISAVALTIDIVIVVLGLQLWTFGYR
jgi:Na+/H+ antiporter NhaD/arsenite permease-like protein